MFCFKTYSNIKIPSYTLYNHFAVSVFENEGMIILSDEVGWGVRPRDEKSRLIQMVIGNLNRYIAQIADEVNIVECGIARRIK